MFNIELKFTVDCLKFWFNKNKKVLELGENLKDEFLKNISQLTVAFMIFRWKVELLEGGLNIFAEQNICF